MRTGRVAVALLLFGAAASLVCTIVGVAGASPTPSAAHHQTESEGEGGEAIGGFLRDEKGNPVQGVRFVVRRDGRVVGRGTTDDTGEWVVDVPAPGVYRVAIVLDTLPRGKSLRDPEKAELTGVEVIAGQTKRVIFPLGPPREGGRTDFEVLSTLAVSGIRFGLVLAVASIGLSMIFGVTGLVNFAHGELVTFGAIIAFFFADSAGGPALPLIVAAILAMALGGGLGFGLERVLWRPLRNRRSGNVALIVVSIGLGLVLRHVYLMAFGERPRPYKDYAIQRAYEVGPVSLPPKDYVMILVCVVVLVAVGLLLQRTRLGIAMRAVADERDLAAASGVDVRRVITVTWVSGAALAALGGVLQGVSDKVVWDMGLVLLLLMFAAVLLGGLGTAYGAMVGGLLIGVVTEVSTFWISSKYKVAVALVVLIAAVLFRPQGLLGRSERVG